MSTSHMKPPPLIFGPGNVTLDPKETPVVRELIEAARAVGIKSLDTARTYGGGQSEHFLGQEGYSKEFCIITKAPMGFVPGGATRKGIVEGYRPSEKALNVNKVAAYLLHHPDEDVSITETMDGIQDLYLAEKFDQFGLSNFNAQQVQECYDYAKSKSYVLPTIYQTLYGPASRRNEETLFPLLRKLNISIQGYSPLGTGFLTKTPAEVRAGKGYFDPSTILGKILQDMYGKESFLGFLDEYGKLAEEAGISRSGLAYRWMAWNSALREEKGDGVVFGARSKMQLEETVEEIKKGPLEQWVVEKLNEMWKMVEKDAPCDNFETFKKLRAAGAL